MGRREENKQKKNDRLLAEGLRLFLEQGYDRASIEQVAAASDVARGTFYLYFPDKLALFEALVDRWWKPLLDTLEDVSTRLDAASTPLDALTTYLEMAQSLAETALAHREEVLLGFREVRGAHEAGQRMRSRELQLVEAATALTEKAADKGLIEVEDARLATLVILGAVERMHYEWLVGGDIGDQSELPEKVMRLMARMLGLPLP